MRAALLIPLCLAIACDTGDKGTDTSAITDDDDTGTGLIDSDGDGHGSIESGGDDCDDADGTVNPDSTEIPYNGKDDDCDESTPDDDLDGDGFVASEDCDDDDATVNPDAIEACDGVDNDCNGDIDDSVGDLWYADGDGDGYGDADISVQSCDGATGYVADATDCDDTTAEANPGATEVCDEIDNDCDGDVDEDVTTTWYVDADGDGYGVSEGTEEACSQPAGYAGTDDDCDDSNDAVNPAATEVCNDIDDDCDGDIDEDDAADVSTWYADTDGDGYGDPDSTDLDCDQPTGFVDNDQDCDDTDAGLSPETVWYIDYDGDGYGDDGFTTTQCDQPSGYVGNTDDCDDADAAVSPAGTEVCNDTDDDCDGTVDEDDASDVATWYADTDGDGYGDAASTDVDCDQPTGYVENDDDCDDSDAGLSPETTWYADTDGDGHGDAGTSTDQCEQPTGYVDSSDDCDDADEDVNPSETEVCNGIDDDCDGATDDADSDLDTSTATTWYADTDGDGYGDASDTALTCTVPSGYVSDSTDCDDADADVYPGADEEWFDGTDSDCDGDEDPDACDDEPPESTTSVDSTCTYTPSVGSFNPETEWSMTSFSDSANWKHCIMTPVVGQMTDDDGDSDIDSDDTPDIAAVFRYQGSSTYKGVLRLISGDGSSVHWTAYDDTYGGATYWPYRYAGAALGDIDLDGEPEIVTTVYKSSGCYAGAYDNDGNLVWVNSVSLGCRSHAPALADLEGDGDVEVVMGRVIIEGADGSTHAQGTGGRAYHSTYSNSGYHSVPVDLDGDGTQEIVAGSSVYDPDGNTLCSTGYSDGYVAVADLDDDGDGEFVVSGNGYLRMFEDDCTYIDGWAITGSGYGGPPTIADFDGDGDLEIAVAAKYAYAVYETDGTTLWSNTDIVDASSNSTGSSVFDFDGDGAAEVVYADEYYLWVFDGATGTALYQDSDHGSGTVNEYPVIADVDGDGKAEIVVANDYTDYGIMVVGDADDEWVSARTTWNQHAYSITNINDDLSIPTTPDDNWPTYNNFRQGAPGSFDPQGAANLYPVAYSACQDACGDDVDVIVQVGNDGQVRGSSDLVLAIYGEDSAGTLTLLDSTSLGTAVDAGELSAAYTFSFTASEVVAYSSLVASIDDDEASNECDESDNTEDIDISTVCE